MRQITEKQLLFKKEELSPSKTVEEVKAQYPQEWEAYKRVKAAHPELVDALAQLSDKDLQRVVQYVERITTK